MEPSKVSLTLGSSSKKLDHAKHLSTPNNYPLSGQEHLKIWNGSAIWENASKYLGTSENWHGFELAKLIKLFFKSLVSTN